MYLIIDIIVSTSFFTHICRTQQTYTHTHTSLYIHDMCVYFKQKKIQSKNRQSIQWTRGLGERWMTGLHIPPASVEWSSMRKRVQAQIWRESYLNRENFSVRFPPCSCSMLRSDYASEMTVLQPGSMTVVHPPSLLHIHSSPVPLLEGKQNSPQR